MSTILVISHQDDAHAVEVLQRLRQRGAYAVLFDTGRIPRACALTIEHGLGESWSGSALVGGERVDFAAVRAAWWRRPQALELHPELRGAEDRGFAIGETHAAVTGLWSCLDASWINPPDRDEAAARKAWQLKLARALGLAIPRTCITSDPVRAREFVASEGSRGTIYKSFSATEKAWRETRLLKEDEAALLDAVRYAPVIFQEYIRAAVDLRITVVGRRVFAAEIHSQTTSYPVDFRMTMHESQIAPHELPVEVEGLLLEFMGLLGLVYGAIDMRLTPEGKYVFLEINPAGQWLFVEQRTGQGISDALAEELVARSKGQAPSQGLRGRRPTRVRARLKLRRL
jgi:hypothetical protein